MVSKSILFPFIQNFHPNSISKAFILNALVSAIIAALTIEARLYLNRKTKDKHIMGLQDRQKMLIVMILSFLVGLLVFTFMFYFSGFGSGMMCYGQQCGLDKFYPF
jgi:hypothetical protein